MSLDDWDFDEFDDEFDEDEAFGFTEEDCGRWDNGRLTNSCRLLGTEDCDWECPLRYSLFKQNIAARKDS